MFSAIILTVRGLNSPMKRYRLADRIRKLAPAVFWSHEIHSTDKDAHIECQRVDKNLPSKQKPKNKLSWLF